MVSFLFNIFMNRALFYSQYYYTGLYNHVIQATTWAINGLFCFVKGLLRYCHSIVQKMFAFGGNDNTNKLTYEKAVWDGWYVKNPLCFMIVFQEYFYSMDGSFAYQFEQIVVLYDNLLVDCQLGKIPIIPLSQLWLDDRASLTLLVVSSSFTSPDSNHVDMMHQIHHNFEEWACGSHTELLFSTWDTMHASHYYALVPQKPFLMTICETATTL